MAPRRDRGFALTEVLVAAALLGLGLLGQLALLGSALRTEQAAMNLANAATLAADLAERLRANSAAALAYAIDAGSPPPAPAECALAAPFDAPMRAACDLDEWRQQAATSLPNPVPEVSCATVDGTGAVLCAITIRWDARTSDGDQYVLHVEV